MRPGPSRAVIVGGLAVVLLVLAVAVVALREELARRWIRARVGEEPTFRVREIGLYGITLSEVRGRLETAGLEWLELDRLHVGWTPLGLLRGALTGVEARGLRAQVYLTGETFAGEGASGGAGRGWDPLPAALRSLEWLTLEEARVDLHLAGIELTAWGGLTAARSAAGDLAGSGVVSVRGADTSVLLGVWLGRAVAGGEHDGSSGERVGALYLDARVNQATRFPARGSLSGWLELDANPDTVELRAPRCLSLRIDGVRAGFRLREPIETCLEADGAPVLRLVRRERGLEADARARATAFGVRLEPSPDSAAGMASLEARVARLVVSLHRAAEGASNGTLHAQGEHLRMRAARIEAVAWQASAELDPDGQLRSELVGKSVRDLAVPVRFAPFRARVSLRGTRASSRVEIAMTGRAASGLELTARGHHDLARSSGELELDPRGTHAAAAVLAELPLLGTWIRAARGDLGLGARAAWGPAPIDLRIDVMPRGLELATPWGALLRAVQGHVRLLGPEPWRTPGPQELRARSVEYGFGIEDASVRFELTPEGVLAVESAQGRLAGGELQGSGRYDPATPSSRFELRVAGIELAEVLERIDLPGLHGSGSLSGTLPLVLEKEALLVRGGELVAREGRLQYDPSPSVRDMASERQGFALALTVLRDFHYDLLRLRVDGPPNDRLDTSVYLQGRNPDFERGREVQFTLSLDARPRDLLRLPSLELPVPIRDGLGSPLDPPLGRGARAAAHAGSPRR